jgi:ATP-dependent DNA helicase RecG
VRQRLGLSLKGEAPDLLVMTATPIPRSLALALYGDLDLSTIDELPPGRQPVRTRVVGESGRRAAWELLRSELARGRRGFVVCPLLEQGDDEDTGAAERMAQRLAAHAPEINVGLVHGRMPLEERHRAMERFRSGETPLLVATTVVEVGIDVPEATVMIVERAERFGLSQLHQLRGRVGRGAHPGHCLLLTGPRPSPEALERLAVMARTADGFEIAEADLGIRGPGHLAGTRQAGLAGLRLADLARDRGLLAEARAEARRIVAADPLLESPAHRPLRALAGEDPGAVGGAG